MKKIFISLALLIWLIACVNSNQSSSNDRCNVIIIFTDDQGYNDLGCFGSPDIETPNLDQMAEEGLKLTNFYAAQPICSASRAALLTGCYANRVGVHMAYMPANKYGLNPSEVTIADMLKSNHYATGMFGKWHLGDHPSFMPNNQGFDEYYGIPYSNDMWPLHPDGIDFPPLPVYKNETIIDTLTDQSLLTTEITNRSIDFIEQNKEKPFFLYIAHPQPHVPLYVSDKFKGKSKRGLYGDVIMEIDWSVGEILKSLKENKLDENTIVIFTSDNGPWLSYGEHSGSAFPLREGKQTTWEGGQREPCIIRYPTKLPKGKTINTPIMTIDLLPTIASLTGSKLPENIIDGKNIWEVLIGNTSESPQEAYFFYYDVNALHGIRYENWKMYYPRRYKSLNGKEGGKGGFPVDYEFNTIDEIQLYDLSTDIEEQHNVADKYPKIIAKMDSLSDGMRVRLGDTFRGIEGRENRVAGVVE